VAESLENQPAADQAGSSRQGDTSAVPQPRRDGGAPQDGGEGAKAQLKARVESLDIVKAVLIILVVFCHLVEHFGTYDPLFRAVYSALSLYGLPLFVLTSGMLAKPLLSDNDYRKMFAKLLLPLIFLQPFYLALYARAGGDAVRHILDPQWLLWFLLCLCFWRMMLPFFVRIPFALAVAVAITLAAGYAQYIGADLSLSRTLYFFPFFLAGYLWRERLLKLIAHVRLLWGLVFIVLMVGTGYWFMHGLDPNVVYHDRGYDQAAVWKAHPALGMLGMILISSVGAVAWFAIMPRSSRWLVHLGQRTLTILALHGFLILVCLKLFNMAGWTYSPSLLLFPLLLLMSVAIAWVVSLCDGPFNRFFDWLAARLSRFVPRRA
jgi:fucose 4-O-acetylase-like acetyltransferase